MESSKRAVEAYRRTRLIDHVIADDDKIAPVYRLEEICDTLRSSSADMVREMVDYSMRRLESKSPRVKQKVLRMFKYCVAKGGSEFRRQVQRQSQTIRALFDYKGQSDPLKGDALNKAVRETAHEAIAAIFSKEEKAVQFEDINKRIMGFGSTNYETQIEPKKSSISDVVTEVIGLGSASIKQSLSMISAYTGGSMDTLRNDPGTYRGLSLRRSLTSEKEEAGSFENEGRGCLRFSLELPSSTTGSAISNGDRSHHETGNGSNNSVKSFSQEDKLLDTITAPGGMRLQPTRETLQAFLNTAVKLDPKNLAYALDLKLRSNAWQVRFKALCILEVILQQQDNEFFGIVFQIFEKDPSAIHDCLEVLQTSLRDKAKKVLCHLRAGTEASSEEQSDNSGYSHSVIHELPDLIDTRELKPGDSSQRLSEASMSVTGDTTLNSLCSGDLLGDGLLTGILETGGGYGTLDDTFAGVSFHVSNNMASESSDDIFKDVSVNTLHCEDGGFNLLANTVTAKGPETSAAKESSDSGCLADLMGNISLSATVNPSSDNLLMPLPAQSLIQERNSLTQMLGNMSNPQMVYMNPSLAVHPITGMGGSGFGAPLMLSHNLRVELQEHAVYQQHGLSGKTNQGLGSDIPNEVIPQKRSSLCARGICSSVGQAFDFSSSSTNTDFVKKEDTRAFDFISDHVAAVRGSQKPPYA